MSKQTKYVPEISSDFAILDVKKGRKALDKMMRANPGVRFKIIIAAEIDNTWSDDDGISQEFGLSILALHWMADE